MDFKGKQTLRRTIALAFLLFLVSACLVQNPSKATQQASESIVTGSSPQELLKNHSEFLNQTMQNWPDSLRVADASSLERFRKMSVLERAALMIASDLSSVSKDELKPLLIPYVKATSSQKIQISRHIQEFETLKRGDKLYRSLDTEKSFQNLADLFSKKNTAAQCETIIPFHPDTVTKPPLVAESLKSNATEFFDLMAFRSMSRSLFVLNPDFEKNQLPHLFSVKMGTDTVESVKRNSDQPHKLLGLQEHVARVNRFAKESSILDLATESGILMLTDSVGLNFATQGADPRNDSQNNGMIIRSYHELLLDKDRLYIPLAKFHEQVMTEGNKFSLASQGNEGGYYWELYRFGPRSVRLYFTQDDYYRMVRFLAFQYGQLMGAYYVNGYTSRDLHGQNLLVGIPLNRNLAPRLALRDLSDHAAFPFMVGGVVSNVLRPIPIHYWHKFRKSVRGSPIYNYESVMPYDEMSRLMLAGYRQIEEKVRLSPRSLEGGQIWQTNIYNGFNIPSYPALFDEVRRIQKDYRKDPEKLPGIVIQGELTGQKRPFLRRMLCARGCL